MFRVLLRVFRDNAIAKSQGGNATLENTQLACYFCNPSKGRRVFPEEFCTGLYWAPHAAMVVSSSPNEGSDVLEMTNENETITHDFPAWRDRSDFILACRLEGEDVPDKYSWEQIWARQINETVFEVCCIPFFSYGLALGDVVNVATLEKKEYVIAGLQKSSGHKTYRIWFLNVSNWASVIDEINLLGCLVEVRWEKSALISLSAPTPDTKILLENYLLNLKSSGEITWECGN